MNKLRLLLASLFVLIAVSGVVFAVDLQVNTVSFGDDNQERGKNLTQEITLTNTNTSGAIEILSISLNGFPSAYRASISDLSSSVISAGGTGKVSMSISIPFNHDAVNDQLQAVALEVGRIHLRYRNANGDTVTTPLAVPVRVQAENNLEFSTIKAIVTSERGIDRGSDTLKDDKRDELKLELGDQVEMEITLKNRFSKSGDDETDIDNADLQFEIDDDSDFEIDEDQDEVDINSGEKETSNEIAFSVNIDAKDDSTLGTLTVDGTDDKGARHGARAEFDIDVKRKSDNIAILRLVASPSAVDMKRSKTVDFAIDISNRGKSNENKVAVEVEIRELNIRERQENIQLDEDDEDTRRFPILLADGTVSGRYTATIRTFVNSNSVTNTETIEFEVINGVPPPENTNTGNNQNNDNGSTEANNSQGNTNTNNNNVGSGVTPPITPPVFSQPPITGNVVSGDSGNSGLSGLVIGLIIAGLGIGVLFVILIVVLIIVLASRKKKA